MFKIPREEEGGREDPLSKKNNENNNKKTGKYRKYLRVTDIIEISDEAGIIRSLLQRKSETSSLAISMRKYTFFQIAHRSYRFFLIIIRIRKKKGYIYCLKRVRSMKLNDFDSGCCRNVDGAVEEAVFSRAEVVYEW